MKLDAADKIIGVKICDDDKDIVLTRLGKCIRFEAKKLRILKVGLQKALGRGINLGQNDSIVSLSITS